MPHAPYHTVNHAKCQSDLYTYTPNHKEIYEQHAKLYDRLIQREDFEGNIEKALVEIHPLKDADIAELGAGTGRLTRLLAPKVRSIAAFDAYPSMLEVASQHLQRMGLNNWRTEVAKHHKLPLPDAAVDIAIAGWSVCYGVTWHPDNWQFHIEAALAEMKRILRPRGVIILLETLGTGYETPTPPPALLPYFALLEATGFQSRTIRTDYRFQSLQEAEEITRFFFGAELAAQVMRDNLIILPECTGIWWLQMV